MQNAIPGMHPLVMGAYRELTAVPIVVGAALLMERGRRPPLTVRARPLLPAWPGSSYATEKKKKSG